MLNYGVFDTYHIIHPCQTTIDEVEGVRSHRQMTESLNGERARRVCEADERLPTAAVRSEQEGRRHEVNRAVRTK